MNTGKFSMEDDTNRRNITITVRDITTDDAGTYWCGGVNTDNKRSKTFFHKLEMTVGCEASSEVKGCEGGWVELTCKYPRADQEYQKIEVINPRGASIQTTTKDVWDGDDRFSLYHDTRNKNLRMAIKQLEHDDSGKYNCKFYQRLKPPEEPDELELKVDITIFKRSPTRGQNLTYWCNYTQGAPNKKFICKGEDPSICQPLWNTSKFSMEDDTKRRNITITVRNVTTDDTGTYWCGAKNTDNGQSKTFFNKLEMTVAASPTSPLTPSLTPPPTPPGSVSHGDFQVIMIICGAVLLLLLLVIIVIFIYKRFSCSKPTRNGAAAQHIREDNVYEEVQERLQETGSGNAVETIYATANFPTNPCASMHYSTIIFQSSTDKANGEALIHKPRSSACEYSTVRNSQSPIYLTVYKLSKTSEDPLLLTVNKTQQQ
ncbi:polymeric immunoglobulin receptor-like [Thunnus maccoyii]|uniref:polymeric immunoglobulin receptor-like n=1 Tax=Thunnus maccoyii TaxID=8240 RepID=UPI001C4D4A20|nr:polymeric immunoglobulin receptor-like [Thunnus maccoyii]